MQQPTEVLLQRYATKVANGMPIPTSLTEKKQVLGELNKLRASDMSDQQKLVEAKRIVADKLGQFSSSFKEEQQKSEDILRNMDKAGFNQMLDRRISENALKDEQPLPGYENDPEGNYKNKLFQSAASVAFEPGSPRQQEAFLVARLERLRNTPGAESRVAGMESQLKAMRDTRVAEVSAQIAQDEDNLSVVEDPAERQQLQEQLNQAKRELTGYLNPEKAALEVYTSLGPNVQQVPGKTPMEKMRNQLVRLEQERRDLEKSLTAADAVEGIFHDTERGKRLAEIDNQIKAIGSVVYFNEGPLTSPEEGAGAAFGRSFADQLMPKGWMKTDVSRQEKAQGILNTLSESGVDISTYDPSKLETLKKKSEGYGMGDPRMWSELTGGTAAFMLPAMVGGAVTAPLKVGKAVSGAKFLGKAAGVIGEAVEAGLAYEVAGRIFPKDSDQLNALSGALGGLGKGLIPAFGKNADAATKAILGRLGSGAGETAEELGNTVGEVWREYGMDNFWKGMEARFPNFDETAKFVVSTFAMGIALGSGTEAGKTLMDQGQKEFDNATVEQQAVMQEAIDELKSEAITIQQAGAEDAIGSAAPQAEVIESATQFEVGKGGEMEAAPEARLTNKEEMLTFAKDRQDFPEAYSKGDPLTKFRLRQDMGLIGQPDPVNTLKQGADNAGVEIPATEVATETTVETPEFAAIPDDFDFSGFEDIDIEDESAFESVLETRLPAGDAQQVLDQAAVTVDSYEASASEKAEAKKVLASEGATTNGKGVAVTKEGKPAKVKAVKAPVTEAKVEKKKQAVKKAVEKPAVERTPEETATVLAAPEVAPEIKQEAKVTDDTRVDNIAASIEGKTPAKVRVSVDGKDQVGAVTKVSTHPKSGKEIYTVEVTDANGNKTTKDVLASMADVAEWNEVTKSTKTDALKDVDSVAKALGGVDYTSLLNGGVYFHGTALPKSQMDFTSFNKDKGVGVRSNPFTGEVREQKSPFFFVTSEKGVASDFSSAKVDFINNETSPAEKHTPRIIPFVFDEKNSNILDLTGEDYEVILTKIGYSPVDYFGMGMYEQDQMWELLDTPEFANRLKELGYDAVKYLEPSRGVGVAVLNTSKLISPTTAGISEAYQKAKADGSNPELVKAVEDVLPKPSKPVGGGQKIKKAYDKWRDAASGFMSMGAIYDPKEEARKMKAVIDATIELGSAVFNAGITEAAAWTKKMSELTGEKLRPMLPKVFEVVKKRASASETTGDVTAKDQAELPLTKEVEKPASKEEPKGESKPASEPKSESKEEEKKEEKKEPKPRVATDPLSTKGETRQRGLEQTLLKEGEVFGDFLTDLVNEAPNLYETIDFEEAMEVAKNRIEEEGLAALHPTLTTKGNIDPVVSAMQGLAMQMYSQMGDNARKAGDMELAAKLNEALDQIIIAAGADATRRGQANGIISQFAFMAPYMDSYVKGRYDKLMAEIMKAKDKSGRTLKERATSAAKDLNKAKKDNAEGIADAVTSSKAVTEAKVDTKRQTVKKNIAEAKAELAQALRAGLMSAKSGIPLNEILDVTAAAAKLGYWTILDGAYKLSDFMKKMKAAGLQDEAFITDLWENSEYNGTKLSDLATEEMKRASAETVAKAVGVEKKTASESAKAKAQYTKDIRDAIANHLADHDGRTLENVLIEDLAMSVDDAAKVTAAVQDKTIEMIGGSIERAANSVKNGVAKKIDKQAKADEKAALKDAKSTVAGRLALALVDGDVTADSVAGKMAEQLGLPAQLTPEMTANLRNLAMAIRNTKEGSKIRHAAEWAFAKAASDALKHIGKDKGFFGKVFNKTNASIYNSLVYAGMLNGIPTHMKNFLSVMPAVLSLGLSGVVNATKWARAAKRAQEYKGPLSKKEVFFYNSPLYEFFFRWKHGNNSFKQAGLEAIDVLRTGKGEYRWEDEVKKNKQAFDQIVESLPVLERTKFKFGKLNPYNHIFGKMVGRALSATDALTSLYYENQEVAFALVGAGLEAGMTMQQIEAKMSQFFTKNNLKWQESMKEAQAEADIAEKFTKNKIPESTIKAEAARLMREKVKEEFSITKEAGQALRSVAKDRIFAYKRHGIIGQLAEALGGAGRLAEKAPFVGALAKVLMKPVVPFTNIVGNMGDALLDTLPIYGIARANGWGGTAIAARFFGKSLHIPEGSKTSMMGDKRSFNDDLYVQQLSRAVSGTLAMMALALIAGDDDDDFLSFSGEVKGNAAASNKVKIFGNPIFDYRMLPELYLPIRFIQAEKEYLKQPQNKDKSWFGKDALATAYLSSIMGIKDMSFLDGVADFFENISRAHQAMEGAASNAENVGKAINTFSKGFLSQHINFALKPIPTNQSIAKNLEKVISPEQEASGNLDERMWYLLGLQSVMGNEKKIDITGNVVKSLPADDIFPLSSWFGLDEEGKAVNKVSMEQKIKNTWPTNEIRTFNEPDPESGNAFTQRMLTPAEYTKAAMRAGQIYAEKVLAYIAGDEKDRKYDTDKDVVYKQTDSKDMPRAQKILNGFRGYAWGAAMKELFGEQTLTQDEFNALIGQEDL